MSKRRVLARARLPLLLSAMSSCAPEFTERTPAAPERRGEPLVTVPVVVTPAQDYRPEVLKQFHDPVRSRLFSGFWFFGYHYGYAYDGPLLYGDSHTHLTTSNNPKEGLPPMEALNTYLRLVLRASTGGEITVAAASSGPDAMRDPARLLPGGRGFVIVPVVDQMDVCELSSETIRHHGSTELHVEQRWNWDASPTPENGRVLLGLPASASPYDFRTDYLIGTPTTSSSGGISDSGLIGNVRIRLLLFRIDGDRVVARSIVYAAGVGNGLATAMATAGLRMARGVASFLTQPGTAGNPSSSESSP